MPAGAAVLAAPIAVAASALVYAPITQNYFHADDFANLQALVNMPALRFVVWPGGGHIYVLRNALYWLLFQTFGAAPAWHFAAVLVTHLVNVALFFALLRALTGRRALAAFGAAWWGTSPMHEETLGWYAVYGHVLVGTLVLVVLLRIVARAARPGDVRTSEVRSWIGWLLLASLTFGVGLGVAFVFPVLLVLLVPRARLSARARVLALAFPPLAVLLHVVWYRLYAAAFGAAEDALPMLFALFLKVQNAATMLAHLLVAGSAGLLGGFLLPTSGYPRPLAFVLAAVFGVLVAAALVRAPAATRRPLLASLVLALGGYAVIAAGRGTVLASIGMNAVGASSSRYHYVPTAGLCVALCLSLAWLADALPLALRRAALLAGVATAALLYARSPFTINHFDKDRAATTAVLADIQRALDAAPPGAPVVLRNRNFPPALLPQYFAGWAALFTIYFPRNVGHAVSFVESDPQVYRQAIPGSRLADVLIPAPIGDAPS